MTMSNGDKRGMEKTKNREEKKIEKITTLYPQKDNKKR